MLLSKRHRLVRIVASILLVGGVTSGAIATAGPALAQPQITLCLTNARQYCADVKDSTNRVGEPIWLYTQAAGAHDFHWIEVESGGFGVCPDDAVCYSFEVPATADGSPLCLGAGNVNGELDAELVYCRFSQGGSGPALWIEDGNWLRNVAYGPEQLSVWGPLYNGDLLYLTYGPPGGALWQQWSGQY